MNITYIGGPLDGQTKPYHGRFLNGPGRNGWAAEAKQLGMRGTYKRIEGPDEKGDTKMRWQELPTKG